MQTVDHHSSEILEFISFRSDHTIFKGVPHRKRSTYNGKNIPARRFGVGLGQFKDGDGKENGKNGGFTKYVARLASRPFYRPIRTRFSQLIV